MDEFSLQPDVRIDSLADDTINLLDGMHGRGPVPASLSDPDLTGRVLGNRYQLVALLGAGGMGQVYKALDWSRTGLPEDRRFVALKVLRRDITERSRVLASLRREFYCAQALSHPHIVRVFETSQDGAYAFFTMEYLEGELLSTLLARTRPRALERDLAWSIIREIGEAIAHAHLRHVVHGDLKPQNIMMARTGLRILDFGTAGAFRRRGPIPADSMQRESAPALTPAYACCEMLDGQCTDARDDVYSLACMFYEVLSGAHPFARMPASEAREKRLEPARIAGLTSGQWQALRHGLAWHREDRDLTLEQWLPRLLPAADHSDRLLSRACSGNGSLWHSIQVRRAALAGAGAIAIAATLVYSGSLTLTGAQRTDAPALRANIVSVAPALEQVALPRDTHAGAVVANGPVAKIANPRIVLTASSVSLPAGERFAEVHVERSAVERNTRFLWWTESSTAIPNEDFIAQGRASQIFSPGRKTTRVFVRIVPNAARTRVKRFYVAVAKPNGEVVTRALVSIPPEAGPIVASN